jgi:hypothetical protein
MRAGMLGEEAHALGVGHPSAMNDHPCEARTHLNRHRNFTLLWKWETEVQAKNGKIRALRTSLLLEGCMHDLKSTDYSEPFFLPFSLSLAGFPTSVQLGAPTLARCK